MAPGPILEALFMNHAVEDGIRVNFESVGGVDAAKRVSDGQPYDLVVLSAKAIDSLASNGHVIEETRIQFARSSVAIAVASGTGAPDISSEDKLRQTLIDATSIGYSTGPSGVALLRQLETWGIKDQVKDKLRQTSPGIPVGDLITSGEAVIGFQQLSELMHMSGIDVIGPMPPGCEIDTTFAGAVCRTSSALDAASRALAVLSSPVVAQIIQNNGMTTA